MKIKNRIWVRTGLAGICFLAMTGCGIEEDSVVNFIRDIGKNITDEPSADRPVSTDSSQTVAVPPTPAGLSPKETLSGEPLPEETLSGEPSPEETLSGESLPEENVPSADSGSDPETIKGREYLEGEWGSDRPENHGIPTAWRDGLSKELTKIPVRAALVVKDGSIIYEYYGQGDDVNTDYSIYSCTKSITSAAVGVAIEQGLLPGVDSRLGDFFPDLDDPQKEAITVGQLLNLTAGFEWTEALTDGVMLDWMLADNQVDYVLNKKMLHQPGEVFNYSSGNTQLLSAIIEKVTGMSEADYVRKNILEPIGIDDVLWWSDAQGITFGGFGIWLTAREAARFGQLYLNEGRWGEQQVVPAEWVRESTVSQGNIAYYGYNWWVDVPEPEQAFRMYYASGFGGQHIIVVPEHQLVAVVMSMGVEDRSIVELFKRYLGEL